MRANRPDEQQNAEPDKGAGSNPSPEATPTKRPSRSYKRHESYEVHQDEQPRYVISVAAQVLGVHPQTLRLYEREGLVEPGRTGGKIRLYSESDLDRVRRVMRLTNELGINLAGVEAIINMRQRMIEMRQEMEMLRQEMEAALDRYRRELDVDGE